MKILFICTANISRSFLAEVLLKDLLAENRLSSIAIQSAGLFAEPGSKPDPRMVDYLTEREIPHGDHASQSLTPELLAWADLILVMEKDHLAMLADHYPAFQAKAELLGQYLPGGPQADDIVDPFGKSTYHYRLAQNQIALAVKSLAEQLLKGKTSA